MHEGDQRVLWYRSLHAFIEITVHMPVFLKDDSASYSPVNSTIDYKKYK